MGSVPDTTTEIEPSTQEIDDIVRGLEHSWTASITVRRQSPTDVGYREVFVSLNGDLLAVLKHGDSVTQDVTPGAHTLQASNTLFRKTIEFTLGAGDHASFTAINRAGWGTYSVLAFFIGFLGAGPFYLTFERDGQGAHGS
jgi:hypothetical protein